MYVEETKKEDIIAMMNGKHDDASMGKSDGDSTATAVIIVLGLLFFTIITVVMIKLSANFRKANGLGIEKEIEVRQQ